MRFAFLLAACLAMGPAIAADHYSAADIAKIADGVKAKAGAGGTASDLLARYGNHHTMLAYKAKSGPAEVHAHYADIFVIERGRATLLTEGSIADLKEVSPGEFQGGAVTGGKQTVLNTGDIVHIPAGVPHQMLVAPGEEVAYFVVKIKE